MEPVNDDLKTLPDGPRTRIVCTIGPASREEETIGEMVMNGMSVARLNLAHGDFAAHAEVVGRIRSVSKKTGKRVAILADLPGPKMRVGRLETDPLELRCEEDVTIAPEAETGSGRRIPVKVPGLSRAVKPGDVIYLSDGFIQLHVTGVVGDDIHCKVAVGGTLRSHKGINLPGVDLGISPVTDYDRECIRFAAAHHIDAVSVSFVRHGEDLREVRDFASGLGYAPLLIAKIERGKAIENIDGIMANADALMIARGDLGVEIPIEEIAVTQKRLIIMANLLGKPVITATQMLESMLENRRPTRAEVTDVSNAILDGTDCVMLSEETAMGRYPVDAVAMMARIASVTEREHATHPARKSLLSEIASRDETARDVMASAVRLIVESLTPQALVIPTRSGTIARRLARFRLPVPIIAMCTEEDTCQRLQFTYGATGFLVEAFPSDWADFCRAWFRERSVTSGLVVLAQGPSSLRPQIPHRIDVVDLSTTV